MMTYSTKSLLKLIQEGALFFREEFNSPQTQRNEDQHLLLHFAMQLIKEDFPGSLACSNGDF